MKQTVTLRKALADPALLGTILAGPSWLAWRAVLIAAMGEPLTGEERVAFQELTGRAAEPGQRVEELWVVAGRRGGKTRAAATLAVYIAGLCDHRGNLAIGERGIVLLIAQNTRQAGVAFDYAAGIFGAVPLLEQLITNQTSDTLELSTGVDLEVRASSFRGLRGVTAVAVLADEIAYWASDDSANPDTEILNAVRPALATTGGPLIAISSPHARRGELYATHKRHFGPQGDPLILVAQGSSRAFNSSLPQAVVDRAMERDASVASAEYGGLFRADLEAFVSHDVIDAAIDVGVRERAPIEGVRYFGFTDPSGGARDAMTLAVAHHENGVSILDATRERRPPFSPEDVVVEFSELLHRYKIATVQGDRYAGEWPRERFAQHKIIYQVAEKTRSDMYRDVLPDLNSRSVALLDNPKIVAQFVGLERRTSRGGRDLIDHAPGHHDDLANAIAGALLACKPRMHLQPIEIGLALGVRSVGGYGAGAPHLDPGDHDPNPISRRW